MTAILRPEPLNSVAKIALAPQTAHSTGNGVPDAFQDTVHWGQSNGCTFRFDPQALPQRSSVAPVPPASRRALPLSVRPAAAARTANRTGGRPAIAVSLAGEAGLEYDYDHKDEADDMSICKAGPSRGANSQDKGAQDKQDRQSGQDTHGRSGQGDTAYNSATSEFVAWTGQTTLSLDCDPGASPMLLAWASNGATRSLRERVLAATSLAAPTMGATGLLIHVRAVLIEAVDSGALMPKTKDNSPDQNCLLPLLLLRSLRPMPAGLRVQACARASAMLSMTERTRSTRTNALRPIAAP
jgi:hypothetical protein